MSAPYPPLLFLSFPLQRAVAASTSLPRRTSSARAVRCTASTTARARGAATARTATTEPSPTPRLWPAQVSPPRLRRLISYIHLSYSMRFLRPDLFSHGWVRGGCVVGAWWGVGGGGRLLLKAPDVFHSRSPASQHVIIIMLAGSHVCFLS